MIKTSNKLIGVIENNQLYDSDEGPAMGDGINSDPLNFSNAY